MKTIPKLDEIAIVLVRPRYPENIGAAARAARNMGIRRLVVVSPENLDMDRVRMMSTHAAGEVVDKMEVFSALEEALAGFSYTVGTTAREGKRRIPCYTPKTLAEKLVSVSSANQVGILFGPEDRGLSNEDLRFCHEMVRIPTAEFSSLNLAQSVMVICYELFSARLNTPAPFVPKLAERHELEGMYEGLKDVLVKISFINQDNPDYWVDNFRKFFNRLPLRAREVRMIRGIVRQINWYGKKCYEDGLNMRQAQDPCSTEPEKNQKG